MSLTSGIAPPSLKILTYNIHKGFAATGADFVLEGIREGIRKSHSEIVFLQEVVGKHEGFAANIPSWPKQTQFEFIADQVWTHYAYGQNAVYSEGHHGNALLSKYPIKSWENQDISLNPYEHRGILHAVVDWIDAECDFHLICTHLNLLPGGRMQQLSCIVDRINAKVPSDAPLILAGDFNDWTQSATSFFKDRLGLREAFFEQTGHHVKTFPAFFPILPLDRIYYRNLKMISSSCLVGKPWRQLSDHVPLCADFRLER